jgi:hypothetical protein
MTHMGIRLQYTLPATPNSGEILPAGGYFQDNHVLLAVLDLAASQDSQPLAVVGLVFVDQDQDGRYSRGEGLPLHQVTLEDERVQMHLRTDETGQFAVPMPIGTYHITVAYQDQTQSAHISLQNEPVMATFPFQLTE